MSRHLFTSDLHLGHERVADLRGFASTAEHDEHVMEALGDTVREADILWVLGDLVGSGRDWYRALGLLGSLQTRVRVVLGNHDPAHPMSRNAWRHAAELAEVVEWSGTMARVRIAAEDVVLSHFPYTRDRGAPRYLQWRPRNEGAWLLHGHTHGQERVTCAPGVREVHVGFDAWGRPVADHEVAALFREEAAR